MDDEVPLQVIHQLGLDINHNQSAHGRKLRDVDDIVGPWTRNCDNHHPWSALG